MELPPSKFSPFNLLFPARLAVPLILSLIFWGSAFPAIRAGLKGYDPLTMAIFRFLVASLSLVPLALIKKIQLPKKKDWPLFLVAAFFSIPGYHVCLNVGERFVTASAASLILSTLPIWTILWSRFFLNESFHPIAWAGVFLSFFGAAIIALGESRGFHVNKYVGFVLLSALCGSIYTIIQKKLISNYDPIQFNCYIIWIGVFYLLPFSSGLGIAIQNAPLSATLSVIYLGLFPGALTFILWAMVIKQLPASRAVVYLYLIPIVATFIGWFWLGELPSWLSLLGGLMIMLGVMIVNYITTVYEKDRRLSSR